MQNSMILMKITDDKLEADWGEIEALSSAYDRGCRTEESYNAKIYSLIFKEGYTMALDDMSKEAFNFSYLLSHTAGNA
jgi:hypothetical protein